MRRLHLILSMLLPMLGFSQSTNISTLFQNPVKKGDQLYDHFAYRSALEVYLHANEKDKKNFHIQERIADCYFKLHDPVSAEEWFYKLVKEENINPVNKFEYAEALSMNGRYDQSLEWFEQYLVERPGDTLAKDKINFLRDLEFYTNKDDRFLIGLPENINSSHSDYGAHYFHKGIVFASSRDMDKLIKVKPADAVDPDESLLNLYYGVPTLTEGGKEPQHFHEEHLRTSFHEGPMAFYKNYKRGAFTQSNVKNGVGVRDINKLVTLQIYFADIAHLGDLKNIEPFEYNHREFSNAHPTFSPDGKSMYFSSTRNSGYGAADIYFSEYVNGHWTYPVNIGPEVNTREDESFPFLANDTTLFFSSNGHGTLGGLDMYVSYKRKGTFTQPINIGYPANTRFDDFSYVSDSTGRFGYFASNRPGGLGLDDVYSFEARYYTLVGTVRELSTEQPTISDTHITVVNSSGAVIGTVTSNKNGVFKLDLPFDQDFVIKGEKEGYENLEGLKFSTKGKPFGIDSLMLPMWKHKLFAKGKIYSNESQEPLEGTVVVLENLNDSTVDSVVIGKDGAYAFVALPNKMYRFTVKKNGFLPRSLEVSTKDLVEGVLLNDFVLEGMYGMREVLRFDYKGINLTERSSVQLENIYRTLNGNKTATVFIGAHADARGSSDFNLSLSRNRAASVVAYLVKKGISKDRIEAVGFGEQLIINRCINGATCTNEEHGENRRAEVKISLTKTF